MCGVDSLTPSVAASYHNYVILIIHNNINYIYLLLFLLGMHKTVDKALIAFREAASGLLISVYRNS